MSRVSRYMIDRGWLHLALVCGVGVFMLPMVWMVGTSLKTDEELTEPGWFPALPRLVAQSPYVLPPVNVVRPMAVSEAAWERALPMLEGEAHRAIRFAASQRERIDIHHEALIESAASVVLARMVGRLALPMWDAPENALCEAFREMLEPAIVADALEDRLAALEFRGMKLATLDGSIFNLATLDDLADRLVVESGDATIVRGRSGAAIVHYRFESGSSKPIVLRFDFDAPARADQLHKLIVSNVPDDSWHRIDATLTIGDVTWESQRTTWLAQHRPGSIIFQPPSFDDETYRARIWVPLRRIQASGFAVQDPQPRAALRLILKPSSTPAAIYGKAQWNYSRAFRSIPFWTYVLNSTILVVLTTVGTVLSSMFVAYAFARLHWPGRTVAFIILLSTMMLPAQVTMIPSFMIWRTVGWYNTLNPMWVPALFGTAFFIFLMVQHMKTIPKELEEAARIDGLNAVQTWWYVIVPLVKPAAAAVAIMTVMGAWNEFMGPLIYLRDQSKFPLSLGLFAARLDAGADWTMIMAGNVLMTLPMVVLFIVFQRHFIQGMTMSGMKG